MKRITVSVFRDIDQRWEELSKGKLGNLNTIRGPENEGIWIFPSKYLTSIKELS